MFLECDPLVDRRETFSQSQFFDLVFERQLLALQFPDLQVIGCGMVLGIFKLFFEHLVAALQFDEMVMQRHRANPPKEIAVDSFKSGTKPNTCKRKNSALLDQKPFIYAAWQHFCAELTSVTKAQVLASAPTYSALPCI
jgi:hypothetical protein